MHRRIRGLFVAVMIVSSLACGGGGGDGIVDPPETITVSMPGNSFSPFNATIHVNGIVRWEFPSDEHDVVFVEMAGAPANIPVTTRATVSRTFSTIGVFPYDCRVHPGMSGQVTVTQ